MFTRLLVAAAVIITVVTPVVLLFKGVGAVLRPLLAALTV